MFHCWLSGNRLTPLLPLVLWCGQSAHHTRSHDRYLFSYFKNEALVLHTEILRLENIFSNQSFVIKESLCATSKEMWGQKAQHSFCKEWVQVRMKTRELNPHYAAESLSWYSRDRAKQVWTPPSLHRLRMALVSSADITPPSAELARENSWLASSWQQRH